MDATGKSLKSKNLSEIYDALYAEADRILKQHDPCCFSEGKCRANMNCCMGCSYLSGRGCRVKAIACKLWLCDFAIETSPECAAALRSLEVVAEGHGLLGYREPKREVMRRSPLMKSLLDMERRLMRL